MKPLRRPRLTIRTHLALIYGTAFTVVTIMLLAGVYLVLTTSLTPAIPPPSPDSSSVPVPSADPATAVEQASDEPHGRLLQVLGVALFLGAIAAIAVGWLITSHALSPIRRITTTARRIASGHLHERVALTGPADEIKELADTIDDMLTRLEKAFDAQRRFAANASHELLTPLTTSRAILEVAAARPASCDVHALTDDLLSINEQSEHLVDSLLALTQAEHGAINGTTVNLVALVGHAIDTTRAEARDLGVAIDASLTPATVHGDPELLSRLIVNLLTNAIRHNKPGGDIAISLVRNEKESALTLSNTGRQVQPDMAGQLFEPFVRAEPRTQGNRKSHGLGMAIVRAVAEAHLGVAEARANPGGGLTVTVRLPNGVDGTS